MKYPGFCGDSYQSQSRLASVARTVNFYPEIIRTEGAATQVALYPTPGVRAVGGPPQITDVGRGVFQQTNRAWDVFGDKVYEVTRGPLTPAGNFTATHTLRGTVAVDFFATLTVPRPATFAHNGADAGHQLAISSGSRLYILDLNSHAFAGPIIGRYQASTEALVAAQVVYLQNRFIVLDATKNAIQVSAPNDGLTWDPLAGAMRADAADPWRAMAVSSSKELWILGELTGSIFYDSGAGKMPFVPRAGLLITPGIAAAFSLAEVNGSMMWLGRSRDGSSTVVRARGYGTEIVSTEAVNYAIRNYARDNQIRDATAYTYQEQGHHFYVLNFPSAHATWVYDEKTNWWHERGSYNGATGEFDTAGPQYHMYEFGRHLVQDHRRGILYESSIDIFTEAGQVPLRRLRIAPGLVHEHARLYYDELTLSLEVGLGLVNGQGQDPIISLHVSNDGGKTWGVERARHAGRVGEYRPPYVHWHKLGSATDRVFALSMSDPIPWRIIDASLRVRGGG